VREHLDRLVGEWDVVVTVDGQTMGTSRSTFEWLDGGRLLVQRSVLLKAGSPEWEEHAPRSAVMVIGWDDERGDELYQLYSDARGVSRIYRTSIDAVEWRIWRDAPGFNQRFIGEFNADTIDGRWEMSEDGHDWRVDFPLTYTRSG